MTVGCLKVSDEVAEALFEGRPVVALESTIFSSLGLPSPSNRECLDRCVAAVRSGGGVPALTAVIAGEATVGVSDSDVDLVLGAVTKVAARDLPSAVGTNLAAGVTTVSASVTLAARAGIEVFSTGGTGGVHRGAEISGDVSHDLVALSRHRVVTVSAGVKAFLDLARTLEYLETVGVPVVGWKTDRFPAFYTRDSGLSLNCRADEASTVARMFRGALELGHPGGILVANPIPAEAELDTALMDEALDAALDEVSRLGLTGPAVTPVVLGAIAAATDGLSVPANLALAENNAVVATEIAVALANTAVPSDAKN